MKTDRARDDNTLTPRRFIVAYEWALCLLLVLFFLVAYGVGAVQQPENLLFAFAVSLPIFLPVLFLFLTTSHLLFSRRPIVVADDDGIWIPKVDVSIRRRDVRLLRYDGQLTNNRCLVIAELREPNRDLLRCSTLFPVMCASPTSVVFSVVMMAEGSAHARQRLVRALDPAESGWRLG